VIFSGIDSIDRSMRLRMALTHRTRRARQTRFQARLEKLSSKLGQIIIKASLEAFLLASIPHFPWTIVSRQGPHVIVGRPGYGPQRVRKLWCDWIVACGWDTAVCNKISSVLVGPDNIPLALYTVLRTVPGGWPPLFLSPRPTHRGEM
jgi:hypothetical protein